MFQRLLAEPPKLLTTTLVVAEGHGWFLKRYDGTLALQWLAMIESMPIELVAFVPAEQTGSTKLLGVPGINSGTQDV